MPDEAEQLKIEKTTGVPRDPNWWDKVGLGGIATGGGLAVYLAFVVIPDLTVAIKENTVELKIMQSKNEAHYRAMSDDRRIQLDEVRTKLTDIGHNVNELRRTARSESMKAGSPAPDKQ